MKHRLLPRLLQAILFTSICSVLIACSGGGGGGGDGSDEAPAPPQDNTSQPGDNNNGDSNGGTNQTENNSIQIISAFSALKYDEEISLLENDKHALLNAMAAKGMLDSGATLRQYRDLFSAHVDSFASLLQSYIFQVAAASSIDPIRLDGLIEQYKQDFIDYAQPNPFPNISSKYDLIQPDISSHINSAFAELTLQLQAAALLN